MRLRGDLYSHSIGVREEGGFELELPAPRLLLWEAVRDGVGLGGSGYLQNGVGYGKKLLWI